MVPLINIMLVKWFSAVLAPALRIFVFVVLAVFIAGLMVAVRLNTWGKKSKHTTSRWPCWLSSFLLYDSRLLGTGSSQTFRHGRHFEPWAARLSQILYAYVSSTGNNGSAFAGINANTMWYNTSTAVAQCSVASS